jgi:hypothetical protein
MDEKILDVTRHKLIARVAGYISLLPDYTISPDFTVRLSLFSKLTALQ